jgi:hypothetical protein
MGVEQSYLCHGDVIDRYRSATDQQPISNRLKWLAGGWQKFFFAKNIAQLIILLYLCSQMWLNGELSFYIA